MVDRDDDFALSMLFSDPSPNGHINRRINIAFLLNLDKVDLDKQAHDQFMDLVMSLARKLVITWRHLDRYRQIEDGLIEIVRTTPLRVDGKRTGFDYSQELYAEFDGFLVQLKSSLDYLVKVPTPIFGARTWKPYTFGDKGDDVIKMLQRNTPKEYADRIDVLCSIVGDNKAWLQLVIDLRDKINHFQRGGVPYQFFRVWKSERHGDTVLVPMWSDNITLRDALGSVWRKLICFCEEFVGYTLYLRLKPSWVFRYCRIEDEGETESDPEKVDARWEFALDLETLRREEFKQ